VDEHFDVAVIGSGPGGYAAAIRCAQKGARTAVVEKDLIGGTCLNRGCIPSKALLASAQTLLEVKHAPAMGIEVASAVPNWAKIQARKNAIVAGFRKGLSGLLTSHKVKVFEGKGTILEPGRVRVSGGDQTTEFSADKIILATGSEAIELQAVPFDGRTVLGSTEALDLERIPSSMVIVGGGVIGCELACVYAAIGTNVVIVEALSHLLPTEDEWVGRLLERQFKKLGIKAMTGRSVTECEVSDRSARVVLDSGDTVEAEKVLVAVGRKAVCDRETVESLGLQSNGPAVAVNEKMETSVRNVYAVGDVLATTNLAHGAFAEAEIAAANTTGGDTAIGDYDMIPRAVYTFPEVASVGKTERKCRDEGLDISVGRAFFKANGRSVGHDQTVGEIRVLRDAATDRIVGVTMVGAAVTELIAAARMILGTSEKISDISFPHPSVSEVLKESVEDAFGLSLHGPPRA